MHCNETLLIYDREKLIYTRVFFIQKSHKMDKQWLPIHKISYVPEYKIPVENLNSKQPQPKTAAITPEKANSLSPFVFLGYQILYINAEGQGYAIHNVCLHNQKPLHWGNLANKNTEVGIKK